MEPAQTSNPNSSKIDPHLQHGMECSETKTPSTTDSDRSSAPGGDPRVNADSNIVQNSETSEEVMDDGSRIATEKTSEHDSERASTEDEAPDSKAGYTETNGLATNISPDKGNAPEEFTIRDGNSKSSAAKSSWKAEAQAVPAPTTGTHLPTEADAHKEQTNKISESLPGSTLDDNQHQSNDKITESVSDVITVPGSAKALTTGSHYPVSPSIDVCPFSNQALREPTDQNPTPRLQHEDTGEEGTAGNLAPYMSNTDKSLMAVIPSTRDAAVSSVENPQRPVSKDLPLSSGKRPGRDGNIRDLFPQAHGASGGGQRTDSPKTSTDDLAEDTAGHVTEENKGGDIVLVTGGCGFLGQHIVKLLSLRAPHVAEIRVLDLMHFEKQLDYDTTKPVKSVVGDISDSEFVCKSLQGVNSVIHVAGLVSWGTFPDYEGMERVNVKGTLNVVNACLKNNIQRLVYCSTVDVAVGDKPIRGGTEVDTPVPDKFLFPGYPETKYHGERIVHGSGQCRRHDGGKLQTIILRPNVLYGELDKFYVTSALKMAKDSRGVLYKIGTGKAMFQQAYVGNAAWAFVCADTAMRANPQLTNEVFYIPDNTPIQNSFNFMLPYLEAHGFQLSSGHLSYALSHSAVAAAELFAKAISPLMKLNLPVQSCTIAYINTDLYFIGEKAKRLLDYEPIYTPNQAREMSMKFYASFTFEDKPFGHKTHDHN